MPFDRADVDTDLIIPARYLKRIERTGYGDVLFQSLRYLPDGSPNPEFVLNRPQYREGSVLVAGPQLRLRLLAGARGVGAPGLRVRGGDRAVVRGHLLEQRGADRPA